MSVVVGGPIRAGAEIGDTATPDFARLPDPATLFERRASRFGALSLDHPAAAYLRFLAGVAEAQHAAVAASPGLAAPDAGHLARCHEHALPPLRHLMPQTGASWRPTLDAVLAGLERIDLPQAACEAVGSLAAAGDDELGDLALGCLEGDQPAGAMGEALLVASALQVEMAKLAALLDPEMLAPVGNGACPACGSPPAASLVVGWPRAQGSRYLCCGLCGTAWNYVRIKCAGCGSTKGIAYSGIEGRDEVARAETCDACKGYLKLFQQQKDPLVDPVADDVATLGLDVLLREEGWRRLGVNAFLMGC